MTEDFESYEFVEPRIADRFRGFLPVVVDVETGGFNHQTDALLEIAAVMIEMTPMGELRPGATHRFHVQPFHGSRMDPASLAVNGIDPHHPLRPALPEKEVLTQLFREIRKEVRERECTRAVLVGHNASFDLNFLNAAIARTDIKRNPFHPFSSFDTATLGGVAFGQTVLSRAIAAAGLEWDPNAAHSAIYDAERTAALFCIICNKFRSLYEDACERAPQLAQREPPPGGRRNRVGDGPPRYAWRRSGRLDRGARFGQHLLQLALLEHLGQDVRATEQFAFHVDLRVRRPVRVALERLAQFRVLEDVHVRELRAAGFERAHGRGGESALRKVRGTLHVEHDRVRLELFLDPLSNVHVLTSRPQDAASSPAHMPTLQMTSERSRRSIRDELAQFAGAGLAVATSC